jgi:hypothetical protein
MHLQHIIPVLQVAIAPVILISGVGLLMLSMTNRLAHVIDRARHLSRQEVDCEQMRQGHDAQVSVLWRRARLLRLCIMLASLSALHAALLIVALFMTSLFHVEGGWLLSILFILCLSTLVLSLALFTHDVTRSLDALELALEEKGSAGS